VIIHDQDPLSQQTLGPQEDSVLARRLPTPAPPPRAQGKAAEHLLAYDGITAALLSHRRLTN